LGGGSVSTIAGFGASDCSVGIRKGRHLNHRARRVEESKRELTSFNSRILSLYAFHFAKRNTLFVLWFKVLVAVSLFHFGSLPAHAQANCSTDTSFTYYVRTSGSDSNTGRSYTAAFRTVQKAATVATAGQSVCIAAGCYRERVTLPNSGASDTNRITFVGEAPVVPCFDESTCTILDPSEELTGGWVLATEITGHNNKIWKKTDTAAGVFYAYAVLAGPGGKKYPIFSLSVPGTCVGGTNPGAECNGSGYPSCQGGGTCQGSHTSAYGADYSDWRTALSTGPLLTPVGS
jgi:hypothetical protein